MKEETMMEEKKKPLKTKATHITDEIFFFHSRHNTNITLL